MNMQKQIVFIDAELYRIIYQMPHLSCNQLALVSLYTSDPGTSDSFFSTKWCGSLYCIFRRIPSTQIMFLMQLIRNFNNSVFVIVFFDVCHVCHDVCHDVCHGTWTLYRCIDGKNTKAGCQRCPWKCRIKKLKTSKMMTMSLKLWATLKQSHIVLFQLTSSKVDLFLGDNLSLPIMPMNASTPLPKTKRSINKNPNYW